VSVPVQRRNVTYPVVSTVTTSSSEITTAITELQTVVRGEVERLRMDMIRQFIGFKAEMGRKWDVDIVSLRKENELLREEVRGLRKHELERKSSSSWKLG
jgi:hypothetical protein